MFKYILAAAFAGLTFGEETSLPTPPIVTEATLPPQTLPKCVPRLRGPSPQGGPIPQNKGSEKTNSPTFRPHLPHSSSDGAQTPPQPSTGTNLRLQPPQNLDKPTSNQATIKASESALNTQWKAYQNAQGSKVPQNPLPPPPADAWLKYQRANNLTNSDNIPAAFFQKWKADISKRINSERPVVADGKPISFCDETESSSPKSA